MHRFLSLFACAFLFSASSAWSAATAAAQDDFWKIEAAEVTLRDPSPEEYYSFLLDWQAQAYQPMRIPYDPNGPLPGPRDPSDPNPWVFTVDRLVLLGSRTVQIVDDGEIPAGLASRSVAVVPEGLRNWESALKGWKAPAFQIMELSMVNTFKIKLAHAELKVVATYGGSLNGKGQFLKQVSVIPSKVKVFVGTDFYVWAEYRDPVNVGTRRGEPVAGLGFDIRYKAGTFVNKVEGARDFFVTGYGQITSNH